MRGHRPRRGAAIVAALSVLLVVPVMAAPARGAIDANSGVAAAAFGGNLDVFYNGRDAGLWEMSYAPASGWGGAQEVPGSSGALTSAPAVDVFRSGSELDVFYRNTTGNLGERFYRASTGWSGAINAGGGLSSAPGADVFGGTQVDVFVRGNNNALWERFYDESTGWSSWTSLGGRLTSAPTADVFRGTQVDVFARGGDNGLWERDYSKGAGWSGWFEIPGTDGELASAPSAVVSPNGNEVHVFYVGAGGALFDTWYSAVTGSWSPPAPIAGTAGTVGTAPAAVTFAGAIDVFYLSSNTGLLQVSSPDGRSWQGPVVPGPTPRPAPPTPTPTTSTTAPASSPAPAQTETIKPAKKRQGSRPRVKARVMITWRWNLRGTWIKRVQTSDFPGNGRVTVDCSGRVCPLTVSAGRRDLGRLWRGLEHHRYRRGNMVTIKITEPGHAAEGARFRIRHGQIPAIEQL